ncbi:DNA-directed RNA polymerase subunit beta' [Candidatus Parcubacteria bacterium]|nr:DNA-directed RNA polymerase subunit beta' [Candidatus Parcubacteria bacterium]
METKVTDFKSILIKLASPEKILSWSHGEITKPETINYRTQRAERNGLFCEKIFGPEKDFECYCGKYRRIRYKGIICEKCGVEVTRSIVRRERMGHISLAAPVSHIWFLRGIPSQMGLILNITVQDLERVIYFAGYIVTKVNEEGKGVFFKNLDAEYKSKSKTVVSKEEKEELKALFVKAKSELDMIRLYKVLSQPDYYYLSRKYGEIFEVGAGAEAIHSIFKGIDLEELRKKIEEQIGANVASDQLKLVKRLNIVKSMQLSGIRPEWMFLTVIPVIPPALRPMVSLEGGRHATSDVNDLYRRVINRNNRLKKLIEIKAPEVICRNEKRILQEAVDALIDNSMRHGNVATSQGQKRPLKSLADMLKGKQGRFRQNLLGKRVDYSGRSVIVVGPELKMHQCGLPKRMALELFRPFIIAELLKNELAYNIRGAGRMIDDKTPEVWAALEEVIKNKYVLLNRAPTLHRLGIQAFQPILIEGNAIQVHPLVCSAFNADFDGDQMAVHVPLSEEAQKEAREIMASTKNLLKPGNGEPVVNPSQDIVIGCYWMTGVKEGAKGEGLYFSTPNEAIMAYDFDYIDMRAKIKVLSSDKPKYKAFNSEVFETTVGRLLFNSVLPEDFPYVNEEMGKKPLVKLISQMIEDYGVDMTPDILDKIKGFGFEYAMVSGISWGIDDLKVPAQKKGILKDANEKSEKVEKQLKDGLISESERYDKIIEIWQEAKNKVDKFVPEALDKKGPVFAMISSAARGNWSQVSQMSGMKGLVINPVGKIIDFPVIASYKEGLNVLEYFITTHGARKGEADTALKTSKAGYLTRRLVDVAQDVIVSEADCGTKEGINILRSEAERYGRKLSYRIFGRVLAKDIGRFKKGHLLTMSEAKEIEASDAQEVLIFSPITCQSKRGICQKCYGYDLGSNTPIKLGETVGVVAAQAIGEPGTQLTLRTFHLGGIAGGDITMGLPRIEELFELRPSKNPAVMCEEEDFVLDIKEKNNENENVVVIGKKEYVIPFGRRLLFKIGDKVKKGSLITDGAADIRSLFAVAGIEKTQNYILSEVSKVYTTQGASINDKHTEIIVRQMFSRHRINDIGDTKFNKGSIVERIELIEENEKMKNKGKEEAKASRIVMPISRVSLSSASFLSAASFQDTARVLIASAIEGAEDKLRGLKENVIIGRLIPAGTGFRKEYFSEEEDDEDFLDDDE